MKKTIALILTSLFALNVNSQNKDSITRSPQATPGATDAMYVRSFNAGYIYLIQKILNSKHDIVFKLEFLK
jgi:hypothetical protein